MSGPLHYERSLAGDPRELAKEFLAVLEGFEFIEAEENDSEPEEPGEGEQPAPERERLG